MSSPRAPRRRDDPTHRANSRLTAAATKGAVLTDASGPGVFPNTRPLARVPVPPSEPRRSPSSRPAATTTTTTDSRCTRRAPARPTVWLRPTRISPSTAATATPSLSSPAGEQEFYASKGWENQPARCVECKNAKKARFGEGRPPLPCATRSRGASAPRGDACRFSRPNAGAAPRLRRSTAPCYAFQRGECTRGDACRFSHDPNATAPKASRVLRVPEGRVHPRRRLPLPAHGGIARICNDRGCNTDARV